MPATKKVLNLIRKDTSNNMSTLSNMTGTTIEIIPNSQAVVETATLLQNYIQQFTGTVSPYLNVATLAY